jgi:hypothetical protein
MFRWHRESFLLSGLQNAFSKSTCIFLVATGLVPPTCPFDMREVSDAELSGSRRARDR